MTVIAKSILYTFLATLNWDAKYHTPISQAQARMDGQMTKMTTDLLPARNMNDWCWCKLSTLSKGNNDKFEVTIIMIIISIIVGVE